jgi:hypothetical protein
LAISRRDKTINNKALHYQNIENRGQWWQDWLIVTNQPNDMEGATIASGDYSSFICICTGYDHNNLDESTNFDRWCFIVPRTKTHNIYFEGAWKIE